MKKQEKRHIEGYHQEIDLSKDEKRKQENLILTNYHQRNERKKNSVIKFVMIIETIKNT